LVKEITHLAYTDVDWGKSPSEHGKNSGYCTLMGGNLISYKSKKQSVVIRCSVKARYQATAITIREIIWFKNSLVSSSFCKL